MNDTMRYPLECTRYRGAQPDGRRTFPAGTPVTVETMPNGDDRRAIVRPHGHPDCSAIVPVAHLTSQPRDARVWTP